MTELIIHSKNLDDSTLEQINLIKDHPALKGLISIMPDAHKGAGCVIGFTGKFDKAVIPNIVGVDIGCGVYSHPLQGIEFLNEDDLLSFDAYLRRNIPLGFLSRKKDYCTDGIFGRTFSEKSVSTILEGIFFLEDFYKEYDIEVPDRSLPYRQLGTLGGGNHFIEIEKGKSGCYLTVHSGSRNFGLKVANFFQKRAKLLCQEMNISLPNGLEYLPHSFGGKEYMVWLGEAQLFAHYNRVSMLSIALNYFDLKYDDQICTKSVHNYIGRDGIIRKGAISARQGEKVVIPLNSRDGILLGTGKGVSSYNYSAPHGAGRVHGRKEMKRQLEDGRITIKEYEEEYKKNGIFSTSICKETIDECWKAYKPLSSIQEEIEETINIHDHLKPIYFLKDDSESPIRKKERSSS